jgi:hypothetical protein
MRRSTGNIGKQTVSRPRSGSSESSIADIHQADGNLSSFHLIDGLLPPHRNDTAHRKYAKTHER